MLRHYLELPRAIYIICLGTFLNRAGSFILLFLTPYLREQLHFETSEATRTMSAYGAGSILAALVGGHLADKIGRKTVMAGSLIGGSIILLILAHLRSPWAITLMVLTFALVMDTYRPAASAMIADLVDVDRRQHAFSLVYISINLGFCVAPLVGGALAKRSYVWLFVGDSVTTAVYAIIIIVFLAESLGRGEKKAQAEGGAAAKIEYSPGGDEFISAGRAVAHILADRRFMLFVLASLFVAIVYQQGITTFPLYLHSLGIDEQGYGQIVAVNGIMIVCVQVPLTAFVARFRRGPGLVVGALFIAVGFGMKAWATAPWQFMLTVAVWTVGEMMDAPLKFAVATDLAPERLRARYMGVMTMTFSLGLMIGATVGGEVLERYGGPTLWVSCLVVAVLAAVIYALQAEGLDKPRTPAAAARTGAEIHA
ncbi:MAG: MFS transporter [Phycisphaerales bacterium]|nr:MFS transporter [Phycisphaerales bacterium]